MKNLVKTEPPTSPMGGGDGVNIPTPKDLLQDASLDRSIELMMSQDDTLMESPESRDSPQSPDLTELTPVPPTWPTRPTGLPTSTAIWPPRSVGVQTSATPRAPILAGLLTTPVPPPTSGIVPRPPQNSYRGPTRGVSREVEPRIDSCHHCGMRRFVCPVCFKYFDLKYTYYNHLKTHHNPELICLLCNKTFQNIFFFANREALARHLKHHVLH